MNTEDIIARVQCVEGLQGVPIEQVQWLVAKSKIQQFEEGEFLFKGEDPAEYLFVILSGLFKVYIHQGNGQREITELGPSSITGILPYSRMVKATAYGQAKELSEVLCFSKEHFTEMIKTRHALTEACVHLMTSRVREFTTLSQQNEKMTALGKLSAGLAHELNNPSAAVIRSAQELKKNLKGTPEKFKKVILLNITPQQVDQVNALLFERISDESVAKMTIMQKSNLEDEIADWMEDHEVEEAFELAANFVDFGFSVENLEETCSIVGKESLPVVLAWISSTLVTEKLVDEIESASRRIAALVSSVKTYSHMDQAPDRHAANVHDGLKSTLTLLNHKIKKIGIELALDFDESLAPIAIYVSELNQVWTNLIDNAIDAMEDSVVKKLSILTRKEGDNILIQIADTGAGIPKDILSRIFDPFFTTKEVGKGTGLGLEIGRKVVLKHQGSIEVDSEPGKTVFSVRLPL